MNKIITTPLTLVASAVLAVLGSTSAFAQDETLTSPTAVTEKIASKADDKDMEVITVSSTRRVTSIQETAMSVEAYSGTELEEKGYNKKQMGLSL